MEAVLAALLIGGGATAALTIARRWKKRRTELRREAEADVVERDLDRLLPGDVLVCDERDYLVEGVASCHDGTRRWWEARLSDAGNDAWILVEQSPPTWILLGRPSEQPALDGEPSGQLDHNAQIYQLDRRGQAAFEAKGDMGQEYPKKSSDYARYTRAGDQRIWLRRANPDAPWLTIEGQKIPRHMVTLIPGS